MVQMFQNIDNILFFSYEVTHQTFGSLFVMLTLKTQFDNKQNRNLTAQIPQGKRRSRTVPLQVF